MNLKDFNKTVKKANKALGELNNYCGSLSMMFQPYFNEEISVMYQMGDGFVVVYETDCFSAPKNDPIEEVFNNIKSDKNFYK